MKHKYITKKNKIKKHRTKKNKLTNKKLYSKGGNGDEELTLSNKRQKVTHEPAYLNVTDKEYSYEIVNKKGEKILNEGKYTGPWYNTGTKELPYSIGAGGTFTSNGSFNGIQKMLNRNNNINNWEYEGKWIDGKPDTSGTFNDAKLKINNQDGIVITYEGKFKSGNMQGLGELSNQTSTYVGDFNFSMIEGEGKLTTPTYTYVGEFLNNKKNGKGIYKSGNVTYEGTFFKDKMYGVGRLENTLFIYTGEFENNKINGEGEMFIKRTKANMKGLFIPSLNDMSFEFHGTVTYADGSKYHGELMNFRVVEGETEGDDNSLANTPGYDIRYGMLGDPTSSTFDLENL